MANAQEILEAARRKNAEAAAATTTDTSDMDALLGDILGSGETAPATGTPAPFTTTIEDAPAVTPVVEPATETPAPVVEPAKPARQTRQAKAKEAADPKVKEADQADTDLQGDEPQTRHGSRTQMELEAGRRALERKRG